MRCSLSEFSVLVTGFTCFCTFPFLFALAVPPFLHFHLDLGCYVSFGVESVTLDASLIDVNASGVLTYHNNNEIIYVYQITYEEEIAHLIKQG